MDELLTSVESEHVDTERLRTHLLHLGREGEPVVFVHGNVSSSLFWQRTMLALPEHYRPLAVDLRGFGRSAREPVDARRGLGDYADDVRALLDALGLERAHLVGWSMGGGVVARLLRDTPERVSSLTLVNPVSPFGFGGTHGVDGELNDPSGAGTGGGCANADFIARLAAADRSEEAPTSPRQVFLNMYVRPGWIPEDPADLDIYVESMLSTAVGEAYYPGDARKGQVWPGLLPGEQGVLNAMSPLYCRLDDLHAIDPKPPIRWIRGADDVIVSDTSLHDLAYLGSIGAVEGWPGAEAAPPQPMVAQTRHVLDAYAAAGGAYTEHVMAATGHSPQIERPEEFLALLLSGLRNATKEAGSHPPEHPSGSA